MATDPPATPIQPKTGLFDTLIHFETEAAKLTPGALLQDLRAAQAQIAAYEARIQMLEQGTVALLKTAEVLLEKGLPYAQPALLAAGIVIPPQLILLLENLDKLPLFQDIPALPDPVPAPPGPQGPQGPAVPPTPPPGPNAPSNQATT